MAYWTGDLMHRKQGPEASSTPPCAADGDRTEQQPSSLPGGVGGGAGLGRRLSFIRGIDVSLAHQLQGKPAAEACPSQPLMLITSKRGRFFPFKNQQVEPRGGGKHALLSRVELKQVWLSRDCRKSKRIAILSGLTIRPTSL